METYDHVHPYQIEYDSSAFETPVIELPDSIQALGVMAQEEYRTTKKYLIEGFLTLNDLDNSIQRSLQSIQSLRTDQGYSKEYAKILIHRELEYIQSYIVLYREILMCTNKF